MADDPLHRDDGLRKLFFRHRYPDFASSGYPEFAPSGYPEYAPIPSSTNRVGELYPEDSQSESIYMADEPHYSEATNRVFRRKLVTLFLVCD